MIDTDKVKIVPSTFGGFKCHRVKHENECLTSYEPKIVRGELVDAAKNGMEYGVKLQLQECTRIVKTHIEKKKDEIIGLKNKGISKEELYRKGALDDVDLHRLVLLDELKKIFWERTDVI